MSSYFHVAFRIILIMRCNFKTMVEKGNKTDEDHFVIATGGTVVLQ